MDDMKEQQNPMDEMKGQQQNPEVPFPQTCPIHLKPVELRISKNGLEYYKCPERLCMLFCAAPDVDE